MHCYRRVIEGATKSVNARTVVCSWSIAMLKLCSHLQQSWAVMWTSSALLSAQQIKVHVINIVITTSFPIPYFKGFIIKLNYLQTLFPRAYKRVVYLKVRCLCEHHKAHLFVSVMNIQYMYVLVNNNYKKQWNFSTHNKLHVYKYSIHVLS